MFRAIHADSNIQTLTYRTDFRSMYVLEETDTFRKCLHSFYGFLAPSGNLNWEQKERLDRLENSHFPPVNGKDLVHKLASHFKNTPSTSSFSLLLLLLLSIPCKIYGRPTCNAVIVIQELPFIAINFQYSASLAPNDL